MGYSNPRISHETPIHLRGRSDGSTEVLPLHRKMAQQTSPETRAIRFGRRNHGRNGGFIGPKMVISCDLHHGLATKLRFRTELTGKIWENIIVAFSEWKQIMNKDQSKLWSLGSPSHIIWSSWCNEKQTKPYKTNDQVAQGSQHIFPTHIAFFERVTTYLV